MIALRDIGYSIGERWLFRHLNLQITADSRIGLVGPNGAGKTTLLRIVAGEISPLEGLIEKSKLATIGYLPQEAVIPQEREILTAVIGSAGDAARTLKKLKQIQNRLEGTSPDNPGYENLLKDFGRLQQEAEMLNSYSLENRARKILGGLGFSERDFKRKGTEFSGGWRMRIALAGLLMQNHFLLMLDEPTNHLDIESLQWLEEFLTGTGSALLIISHDSRFLDNLTTGTLEIESGKHTFYPFPFTKSREEKQKRLEQLIAEKKNLDVRRKQIERFIERFRYKASKASQVQSRIRMLENMPEIIIPETVKKIRFRFSEAPRIGKTALSFRNVTKSYDGANVFKNLSFNIQRGDRIALMGVNGAGKSTLARIMAGREAFQEGEVHHGHNFYPAYFAQHQIEELEPDDTVLESALRVSGGRELTELRGILGAFLFSGDDVNKRVSVLSGGEKNRLTLVRILLQKSNFLLLDEPTNHLDIDSREVLQEALKQYTGVLVIVSHDRDFLDPLINKVFELKDGRLRIFPGTCSEYLHRLKEEKNQAKGDQFSSPQSNKAKDQRRLVKRLEAEKRALKYKIIKPILREIEKTEELISSLEERKKEIERELKTSTGNNQKIRELSSEYGKMEQKLDNNICMWEKLNLELEEKEKEFQKLWSRKEREILKE